MINGILNIKKEPGYTSNDVVCKLRGIVRQKKIGHTGTLDPDAVGVLPVCLGKGTRLVDMLTDETKTYEAVLLLGRETDTQDTSGETLREAQVTVSEDEVRACISGFLGDYMQIPPMYSAKKVNGRKLYELAREGIVIERKAVPVTFHAIDILSMELPRVRFSVTCSRGTYIRTLCHDIGEKLGCHGCMEHLTRTRVGAFDLTDSVTLDEVRQAVTEGKLEELLIPIDELFADCVSGIGSSEEAVKKLVNGNAIPPQMLEGETGTRPMTDGDEVRIYLGTGEFVGIFRMDETANLLKPVKMFLERP